MAHSTRARPPSAWPPTSWELRRVVREPFFAFHLYEEGFVPEVLSVGNVLLVEPPGPNGYRDTGLATAFTRRAASMPPEFASCVVRVAAVLERTEEIGTYDGEVTFGSEGAFLFLFRSLGEPLSLPEEKRSTRSW
jgi:hypothetical protein